MMGIRLSDWFADKLWKINLSMPCNNVQYVLSNLKRDQQWNDKMREQVEDAKYVLQIMIAVAKAWTEKELTPAEAKLFDNKWTAAKNILDVLETANIREAYLLTRCTEALRLVDELLVQHELPKTYYNWLKACFRWLGEPFLLSAHADLVAQRDAPPFSMVL